MSNTSELQFIETDAGQIYDFIMYVLENGVTEELYPGDERRIFGETLVPLVVALYSTMNDSAKQSTLRYARGEVLDALGEFAGVFRIEALPATTTVRFSLKEAVTQNIIITKGTRVTSDYSRYFKPQRPQSCRLAPYMSTPKSKARKAEQHTTRYRSARSMCWLI